MSEVKVARNLVVTVAKFDASVIAVESALVMRISTQTAV